MSWVRIGRHVFDVDKIVCASDADERSSHAMELHLPGVKLLLDSGEAEAMREAMATLGIRAFPSQPPPPAVAGEAPTPPSIPEPPLGRW